MSSSFALSIKHFSYLELEQGVLGVGRGLFTRGVEVTRGVEETR